MPDHKLEALFRFTRCHNCIYGVHSGSIFPSPEETIHLFRAIIMSMDPNCWRESVEGSFYLSQNLGLGAPKKE